ncbi:hypothetical protein C4573_03615 [Candidatus Woesearchaeota archaeon]|nr:MAG: hypothetical protein C4573_03615 [Candidatus Woesearchaeota archaeon]
MSLEKTTRDSFAAEVQDHKAVLKKAFKKDFIFSDEVTQHFLKYVLGEKAYRQFQTDVIASSLDDILGKKPAVLEQIQAIIQDDPLYLPTTEEVLAIPSKTTTQQQGRLFKVTTYLPQNLSMTSFVRQYFSKSDFRRAANIQELLYGLVQDGLLNMPNLPPRYVDKKNLLISHPFLEGKTLQETLQNCSDEQKRDYVMQGLEIIAENSKLGQFIDSAPTRRNSLSLSIQIRNMYLDIFKNLVLKRANGNYQSEPDIGELIANYDRTVASVLKSEKMYFMHGDLFPVNLMVQQDTLVPIDWNDAKYGIVQTDIIKLLSKAGVSKQEEYDYLENAHAMLQKRGYHTDVQHFMQTYHLVKAHEYLIIAMRHAERANKSRLKKGVHAVDFEDTANLYFTEALQELDALGKQPLRSQLETILGRLTQGQVRKLDTAEYEAIKQRVNPSQHSSHFFVADEHQEYTGKMIADLRQKQKRKKTAKWITAVAAATVIGGLSVLGWQNDIIPEMKKSIYHEVREQMETTDPLYKNGSEVKAKFKTGKYDITMKLRNIKDERMFGVWREANPTKLTVSREYYRSLFPIVMGETSIVNDVAKEFGFDERLLSAVARANVQYDVDSALSRDFFTLGLTNLPVRIIQLYGIEDEESISKFRDKLNYDDKENLRFCAKYLRDLFSQYAIDGEEGALLVNYYGGPMVWAEAQRLARDKLSSRMPPTDNVEAMMENRNKVDEQVSLYENYREFLPSSVRLAVDVTLALGTPEPERYDYPTGVENWTDREKAYVGNPFDLSRDIINTRFHYSDSTAYATDIDVLRDVLCRYDAVGWIKEISDEKKIDRRILKGLIGLGYREYPNDKLTPYYKEHGFVGLVPQKPEIAGVSKERLAGDHRYNLEVAADRFTEIYQQVLPQYLKDHTGIRTSLDSLDAQYEAAAIFITNDPLAKAKAEAVGKNRWWISDLEKPFNAAVMAYSTGRSIGEERHH